MIFNFFIYILILVVFDQRLIIDQITINFWNCGKTGYCISNALCFLKIKKLAVFLNF